MLQLPIIASIVIFGFQAITFIKEFKYLIIAWSINLIYILLTLISRKYNLDISRSSWFVSFSDLAASYFFLLTYLKFVGFNIKNKGFNFTKFIFASIFIICALLKSLTNRNEFDRIPYINEFNIPAILLDFASLYCLYLFFDEIKIRFPKARLLALAAYWYSLLQFISVLQTDSLFVDSAVDVFYIIAYGLGFLLKFLFLIGLSNLLVDIFKSFSQIDKELSLKQAVGDKLNMILGRTFHELTPPLLEIETITNQLINITPENKFAYRITRKTRDEIEIIQEAIRRAKVIVTASVKMYHADQVNIYNADTMDGLPLPIDAVEEINNVNTLIQIAIMNFKAKVLQELDTNMFVTDKIVFSTEYGANCDLKCNPVQIVQVLYNLFKNSFEACDNLSIKCCLNIKTKVVRIKTNDDSDKMDKFLQIDVEDNGPGIPQDIMSKVFELGFSTKNGNPKDRGFGLDIVSAYTRANNGEVTVESPVQLSRIKDNNGGTRFKILFPKS
ncbi:sensor histidine kinase [Pinibacter soli]|uniref:histidine kinase n=1 Tax=Pinibacter soli TaxID=3044211 RepID=A0ABT6RHV3_9BACT|nr:sensor histidine kinase [Pinibacter soli]MDI3321996.1 sensor histidine kinase [Pinibacter soli]